MDESGLRLVIKNYNSSKNAAATQSIKFSYIKEAVLKASHREEHLPRSAIESLLNFLPIKSDNPGKVRLFPSILKLDVLEESMKALKLERNSDFDSVVYVIDESKGSEPLYIVAHVNIRKYTMTFFDQVVNREANLQKEVATRFGIPSKEKRILILRAFECIHKPRQGVLVEDVKKAGIKLMETKKGGKVKFAFMAVLAGTRLEGSFYNDGHRSSGDAACMQIMHLMNPDLIADDIWNDCYSHRVYILSKIIDSVLSLDSPKIFAGVKLDDTISQSWKVMQRIMHLDFKSKSSTMESVKGCHHFWPKGSHCVGCNDVTYSDDGKPLVIFLCCGERQHAECFLEDLKEDRSHACTNEQFAKTATKGQENSLKLFAFVSPDRECMHVLKPFNLGMNLKMLIITSKKSQAANRWVIPEYYEKKVWASSDSKIPFELQTTASKRSLSNFSSPDAKRQKTKGNSPSKKKHQLSQDKSNNLFDKSIHQRQLVKPELLIIRNFDVGYIEGEAEPSFFMGVDLGPHVLRVETAWSQKHSSESIKKTLTQVFITMEPRVFISCPQCYRQFDSVPAFTHHFNLSDLFGGRCQDLKVSNRNVPGNSVFYAPKFVQDFLVALLKDVNANFLFVDPYRTASKLPALNPLDPESSLKRAQAEKAGMIKYSNGQMSLSEFLKSITKIFLESLANSQVIKASILMSPFFTYMPYCRSLWSYPIMSSKINNDVQADLSRIADILKRDASSNEATEPPVDLLSESVPSSQFDVKDIPNCWSVKEQECMIIARMEQCDDDALQCFVDALGQSTYAIVSDGLTQMESLFPDNAPAFIGSDFPSSLIMSISHFVVEKSKKATVTTEQCEKLELNRGQFASFMSQQSTFLQNPPQSSEESDAGAVYFSTENGKKLHVGTTALYALDLPMGGIFPKFCKGLKPLMEKMLPSGSWCLTNAVRSYSGICAALFCFKCSLTPFFVLSLRKMRGLHLVPLCLLHRQMPLQAFIKICMVLWIPSTIATVDATRWSCCGG